MHPISRASTYSSDDSAKDEKEVAMCIEELKSPGSYHLIISTWVSDSFERKEMERDVLYKLLVNLCKPSGGLFSQAQLQQGYSHRCSFISIYSVSIL